MNIFNYFTPKAETFYLDAGCTIRQALEKFDSHKFSVVPLLDKDGIFISTVSEGDILRYIKNHADFDVSDAENELVMNIERYRPYHACHINVPFTTVMELALNQNFVPLTDDRGTYIGIIKRKTVLTFLYDKYTQSELR